MKRLRAGGDLRPAGVVVLEHGHVDELEVTVVGARFPDSLLELHPVAAGGREARVGNALEFPVTVSGMVIAVDESPADRVEKRGRHPPVAEDFVNQVKEMMALIVGIGMNGAASAIGRSRSAAEVSPALAVLDDDHLAVKPVRVVEDPLDKAPDEVGIGAG